MKWSAVSLVGRQGIQLVLAVVFVRLLGPDAYGIVSAATAYTTIVALALEQGLASALIQRPVLDDREPGAVVTLNVAVGGSLGALTVAMSPLLARFFREPELAGVLAVLGCGLILKSLSSVPRAMLSRQLNFKIAGIADTLGIALGGAVGILVAVAGGGYWAIVAQILVSDAVVAAVLSAAVRGPRPNLSFGVLRNVMAFASRVFVANLLGVLSRNVDNILVGRYLGTTALAYYSIAYRVLLVPVQMLGFVVTRVLFPSVSRMAGDLKRVNGAVHQATVTLAMLAFPSMALLAVSAPHWVPVLFGDEWDRAVLVIQILAFTGARQCVYALTPPLMIGLGRAGLHLRFAVFSAILQLGGVVAGLPFGIVAVATGYSLGGLVTTPVAIIIQRELAGISARDHLRCLVPALHVSLWVVAVYSVVSWAIIGTNVQSLIVGTSSAIVLAGVVLRLCHRSTAAGLISVIRRVVRSA